jgi:hypothetical protein
VGGFLEPGEVGEQARGLLDEELQGGAGVVAEEEADEGAGGEGGGEQGDGRGGEQAE